MKVHTMKGATQDRPATVEEIRGAASSAQDRVLELCRVEGNYCETDSDIGGVIRYSAEEFEFFACLSEMDENLVN